jgi:hypothetical protein
MASTINATTSSGIVTTADNTGSLQLQTTGTTALTVDTSQNVSIGTLSSNGRLTVQSAGTSTTAGANIVARFQTNGSGYDSSIQFSDNVANSAVISMTSGALNFISNGVQYAKIDSSGRVLINTTSTTGGGVTAGLMNLVSSADFGIVLSMPSGNYQAMRFVDGTTAVGSINLTTSSTTYGTSSDYRLKENIAPMTGALDKVAQLKPVIYTWKADNTTGQGFIAHELQEIIPDAVVGEKDAVNEDGSIRPQSIDTSFLVATLTAAIQELKAELDELKAKVGK